MVLLELFLEVEEGKASSLLPGLSGLSSSLRSNPLHGCPEGLYRPTPRGAHAKDSTLERKIDQIARGGES